MYILLAALLGAMLFYFQTYFYKKRWNKNLKADAFFEVSEAIAGDEARLTETIENAKSLPLPMVKMRIQLSRKLIFKDTENSKVSDYFYRTDIYNIAPFEKVKRTIRFVCDSRGYYDFHGVDVIGSDLLYTYENSETVDVSSFLYVYPKPFDKVKLEPLLNIVNGELLSKAVIYEDPFEYKGIREYQTFDSMKHVNWKASAKTDDLLVNMHDSTAKRSLRVFLNFENGAILADDELKELCISMAISFVSFYAKRAIDISVFANSKDVLTDEMIKIPGNTGEMHIREVNRAFARIDLAKTPYRFEETFSDVLLEDNNDYTIILSSNMQEKFQNLLVNMKENGKDFVWICPKDDRSRFELDERLKDKTIQISAKEALYEVSLT